MAELADAHDSKSCGKPCGFESHFGHQKEHRKSVFFLFFQFLIVELEKERKEKNFTICSNADPSSTEVRVLTVHYSDKFLYVTI